MERGYLPQEIKDQMMANYTDLFGRIPAQSFREMILIDSGLVSMRLCFLLVPVDMTRTPLADTTNPELQKHLVWRKNVMCR